MQYKVSTVNINEVLTSIFLMMDFKTLVLLAILVLIQQGCYLDFVDKGPRFDIRQISVGQNSVYFKREIGGRNYEGLSISSDGDMCNGPSALTDFFVDRLTFAKVFYKVEGDEVHIYSQSAFSPPQTGNFPVKVVQKEITRAEYSEERAKELGYTELVFSDDSLKYCD